MENIYIGIVIAVACVLGIFYFFFSKSKIPNDSALGPDELLSEVGTMPESERSKKHAMVQDLLKKYPEDPRVHYLLAESKVAAKDLESAKAHLRTALDKLELLRSRFSDSSLEIMLRIAMANVLTDQDNVVEAKAIILPVSEDLSLPENRELLEDIKSEELKVDLKRRPLPGA